MGCVAINIHPKCPLEIFARPQFVIAIYRSMSLSKDNFASACPWELLTPATIVFLHSENPAFAIRLLLFAKSQSTLPSFLSEILSANTAFVILLPTVAGLAAVPRLFCRRVHILISHNIS